MPVRKRVKITSPHGGTGRVKYRVTVKRRCSECHRMFTAGAVDYTVCTHCARIEAWAMEMIESFNLPGRRDLRRGHPQPVPERAQRIWRNFQAWLERYRIPELRRS